VGRLPRRDAASPRRCPFACGSCRYGCLILWAAARCCVEAHPIATPLLLCLRARPCWSLNSCRTSYCASRPRRRKTLRQTRTLMRRYPGSTRWIADSREQTSVGRPWCPAQTMARAGYCPPMEASEEGRGRLFRGLSKRVAARWSKSLVRVATGTRAGRESASPRSSEGPARAAASGVVTLPGRPPPLPPRLAPSHR
jgi:hypothetical protein